MSTRKCHWPEIPGFSACPPCPLSLIPLAVEVRQAAPQTIRLVCAVDALVGPQRGRGGGRDPAAHPPLPCPLHTSSPGTPPNPGLQAQLPPACGTNYVVIH